MSKVSIALTGDREWILALHEWSDDMLEAAQRELKDERGPLVEQLRNMAPVAADAHHGHPPGTLRDGISATIERKAMGLSMRVRSKAPHATLVEHGTVKMAARPTFIPTVIKARASFNRSVKDILQRPAPKVGTGRAVVVETVGGSGLI